MKRYLMLLRILLLIGGITVHVNKGQDAGSDEVEGEGVVEQYILAREEVEYDLEEFYMTAAAGDEPDMHSDAMESLLIAREQLYKSGLSAKDIADLIKDDPGLPHSISKRSKAISRSKRTIEVKPSRRWTNGLVPYVFTNSTSKSEQGEIIRTMRTYERFTCLRFFPWSDEDGVTTNQKLGLDHESYLTFLKGGGCWSFQGNLRKPLGAGGQKISCCGGVTCIHEIGHAMGESHEQQSPNPDRTRMIRINFDGIQESKHSSYTPHNGKYVKSVGYDLSSYMHYAPWSFRIAGKDTFIKFFPEIPHKNSYYYMMREVSVEHKCQDKCSDFPLTCENDGYLTLVDNKCYCKCIPGLDPETGCTTIFKNDPKDIAFPGGNYAIPAHSTGCPHDSFVLGSRTQANDGGNYKRSPFSVGFNVSDKTVEKRFCIHDSPPTDITWPGANLCLYRRGGKCPKGFTEGFVQYNDQPTEASPNAKSGELPDGVFDDDTRFEYCCSNTGFPGDNLILPSRKPFTLIKRLKKDCQTVRGMHIEVNSLRVGNAKDEGQTALVGGDHPMYQEDKKTGGYWTAYCNYKPAMIDCGEVIQLDYSNSEVTIKSPKGSELECFWLIKGPEGERLQLDFSEFNIKGKPGSCVDDLEVRYVRPGQPGLKFCGPRWDKTTISINNTIHMRLSTYGDSSSQFTATIKVIKDEDLCYAASDRGMTYNGDVDFTRDFEPCLPWTEVSHCEMHPFKTDRFNTILQGNKCRNPDQGTGFQPWCYVRAEGCIRRYCDVCMIGKRFDRVDNCAELKAAGQCPFDYCAKTCADEHPQSAVPVKATDVSCAAPGPAPDGAIVGATKSSYAAGETVEYKCAYSDVKKLRYCLSSGDWSAMGTACSQCPTDFSMNVENQKCYFFTKIKRSHDDATEFCEGKGGFIAFPISEEENVYLKSFTSHSIFLGITDKAVEGTFVTATGEPVSYTNWGGVEPNNYGNREDCAEMNKASTWNDLPCKGYERQFVCQADMMPLKDCLDFSDKCAELFTQHPSMCSKFPTFAMKHCRYTCGLCEIENAPTCKVSTPEADVTELTRGMSVEFSCGDGMIPISGDTVRGCQADGTLSGKPLECTHNCPEEWTLNPQNMFCYKKFNTQKNFADAEADCVANSGTIATAADADEQAFVQSLKGSKSHIWLGLTDSLVEGTFRWADGTLLSYSKWKNGEPNNYGKKGEDCGQMRPHGEWNDNNCDTAKLEFICKAHVEEFGENKWFWSTLQSSIKALENVFE